MGPTGTHPVKYLKYSFWSVLVSNQYFGGEKKNIIWLRELLDAIMFYYTV